MLDAGTASLSSNKRISYAGKSAGRIRNPLRLDAGSGGRVVAATLKENGFSVDLRVLREARKRGLPGSGAGRAALHVPLA